MRQMGFLIFISIFLILNFYVYIRGYQALPPITWLRIVYTTTFIFTALSFIIAFALEGKLPAQLIALSENIGGLWMISFLYFVIMILLADLFRLANFFFHFSPEFVQNHYSQIKLIYAGFVLLVWFILCLTGYIKFSNPTLVHLNLDVPARSSHLKKLHLIAVSDVHLGDVIRKNRLKGYVDTINSQNPDLIVIAGDLFDRNMHSVERQHMETELGRLKAKYGVFAIFGNHEYYGNLQKATTMIKLSGIQLLRDSSVVIDHAFILTGRDDLTNKNRKSLAQLLDQTGQELPVILLDHQPYHLEEAENNKVDLQISGHTHNGQIYPINKIVNRIFEVGYGYKKKGNTHIYVSSGLGLWGAPVRLGTQSEIVDITLNFK